LKKKRESEKAIMVRQPTDRIDVWWNLATDQGEPEPGPTKDFSLDEADDLIDAMLRQAPYLRTCPKAARFCQPWVGRPDIVL